MVEKLQTPSAGSKQWEPHEGRERGRRENSQRRWCVEKGSPPPLFIVLRGVPLALPPQGGTIPTTKGGGSWPATMGAKVHGATPLGGNSLLPLMGPNWPISGKKAINNYLNHIFNI